MRKVLSSLLLVVSASFAYSQVATGSYPYGTFDNKGFDTINVGNLNVHFSIPIINKPGRGLPFWYNLGYDSSIWYRTAVSGSNVWTPVQSFGWKADTNVVTGYVSYNETFGNKTVLDPTTQRYVMCSWQTFSNFVYHDPFGVQHSFYGTTRDDDNNPSVCNLPASTTPYPAIRDSTAIAMTATAIAGSRMP
jgi:hypothetical protein